MTTRETTVKLTVADNFSAQLRSFATALDQSEKAVKSTSSQMSLFDKANKQLADGVRGGITMAMASLPAVIGAAGLAAVKMGMDMEQTRVAFTTLTGSVDLANKHLQDLRDFAKSTPFQFTELTAASKKMQAFGFATENVIPMLTDIGDAVSALGSGGEGIDSVVRALGQMQTKGKVSAEEMNQLTEAGIKGWEYLARGIGKSTGEVMALSQRGLLPAGDAIQYILKGMREDFGGGMAAQSKTAAGQMSNLVDSLEELGSTIGEILLPAIKSVIKALSDFAGAMRDGIKTADLLINWNTKLKDAYTSTEEKIRSSSKTYKEYEEATIAVAKAAGLAHDQHFMNGEAVTILSDSVKMLTEEEWNNYQAAQSLSQASNDVGTNMSVAADQTARLSTKMQEQSDIMTPVQLGMQALADASRTTGKSQEDFNKWVDEGAKASERARGEIAKQTESYIGLGASLKDATQAQIAQQAIVNLNSSLEAGIISPEKYRDAVRGIQIEYGIATEKSIAAGDALLILNGAYADGTITSDQYKEALAKVNTVAADGKVSLNEFGLGVQFTDESAQTANPRLSEMGGVQLPKVKAAAVEATDKLDLMKKSTDNSAEAMNVAVQRAAAFRLELIRLAEQINKMPTYSPQTGSTPQARAMGGPVLPGRTYIVGENGPERLVMGARGGMVVPNTTNNNQYTMNVYTNDAASPIREFGLMQALAGAQ